MNCISLLLLTSTFLCFAGEPGPSTMQWREEHKQECALNTMTINPYAPGDYIDNLTEAIECAKELGLPDDEAFNAASAQVAHDAQQSREKVKLRTVRFSSANRSIIIPRDVPESKCRTMVAVGALVMPVILLPFCALFINHHIINYFLPAP